MTPQPVQVALARFKTVQSAEAIDVAVHFNPASLQYTVANTLKEEGQGAAKKQYVSQTTAKLTMDLVFDTTQSGQDVRGAATPAEGQAAGTDQMAKLLKPHGPSGKQVPPLVEFSWGAYRFTGMVESYKETLDYFSADGVPLRAGINLTLSSQEVSFDSAHNPNASVDSAPASGEAMTVPTSTGPGGGAAGLANSLGDPRAARAIATANGSASLRFSGGAQMAVAASAGVTLSAAAAFSTGASVGAGLSIGGGAGIGAGAGVGFGASAGASAGAGFGVGASAGASFGAGGRGFGASAGVSSSGGAFAGLRSGTSTALALPTASVGFGAIGAPSVSGAAIGVGGRVQAQGGGSLSANVGAKAELGGSIRFGV